MILILQHKDIEGPGTIRDFFESSKYKIKIIYSKRKGLLPETLDGISALIILGGPMNVYQTDKYPFLIKEEKLIKEAIEKEIPTLGLCLGAQLIAKVLGSKVKPCNKEQIGWYKLTPTKEIFQDLLLNGNDSCFVSFQWHQDTFELPKNAKLLVTEPECKNQAFRIKDSIWGLQFHPEMNRKMLIDWLNEYKPDTDIIEVLNKYEELQEKYKEQAENLYLNFSRVIEKRLSFS